MRTRLKLALSVFAPWVFALGKITGKEQLINMSSELEPLYTRSALKRIEFAGYDIHRARRFAMTPHFIASMKSDPTHIVTKYFHLSQSQLLQDIFVLLALGEKTDGFFVEVGVGDGMTLSNTYCLEKYCGWRGILCEPNRNFGDSIANCRSATLDRRAAYSTSNEMIDFLADEKIGETSTIEYYKNADLHVRKGLVYKVRTVTLEDLLSEHNAPEQIDYVSIDTEGSEFEIIKDMNLNKRRVSVFTIESNNDQRKLSRISEKLESFGYRLVLPGISGIDSWFVHKSVNSIFL